MKKVSGLLAIYFVFTSLLFAQKSPTDEPKNMSILNNIVAAWRFEESSGTRFDFVGNYDLTDNNTVGVATGKVGNAASFVLANSESLSIASDATHGLSASLSGLSPDWTITGWVYLNSKLTTQAIISKWDAASGALKDYLLQYNNSTDRFEFVINNGDLSNNIKTASADSLGSPSINTWYFIAAWYDSTQGTVNIKVNAKAVDSIANLLGIHGSATDFYIGREATSGTPYFLNGRVDAVHIWRRVLTPAERKFLYNNGNGREYPFGFSALANNVAAYKFEEGTGQIRKDATGRGNDLSDESNVGRTAGLINYAANFDGVDDYLYSFWKPDFQVDGDFTLAFWFYPTGSGAMPLVNKRDSENFEYWMYIDGGDIFAGMGIDEVIVMTDGVASNAWNLVILSYHAGTNEVHMQLNNGEDLSGSAGPLSLTGDAEFQLGQADYTSGRFEGRMDALNIWKRILSTTERSNLFNSGAGLEYPFGGLNFQFSVDWNADGAFDGTNENVTNDVDPDNNIAGSRGKDAIRILAPPKAGDFGCELRNQQRVYSIENSGSPLFNNLEPGRKVRLTATHAMQSFDIWGGVLDDIPQHSDFSRRSVELACLGSLSQLTKKKISTPLYVTLRTDEAIGYLLDAVGWPATDRILHPGQTILRWWWLDDADAFAALVDLLNTEGLGAAIYEDAQGRIVFENRSFRFAEERATVSQHSFSTTENIKALGYNRGQKNIINKCSLDVVTRALQSESVVWSYGSTLTLAPGEVKQIQAKSSGDPFSGASVPSSTSGTNEIQIITLIGSPTNGNVKFGFREQVTGDISASASASAIQTALESLSTIGAGNVSCTGGNLNAHPVFVQFIGALAQQPVDLLVAYGDFSKQSSAAGAITAASGEPTAASLATVAALRTEFNKAVTDLGNIETTLNGLTQRVSSIHTAFGIYVDVDTEGVVPDYVLLVGSVDDIMLDRTSGGYVTVTITAGASGATITGLQLRAQLATIAATNQVMSMIDASDSIEKYGDKPHKPQIRSEIDIDFAQSYCDGVVYLYKDPRSTVGLEIEAFDDSLRNRLLSSEVSDRITIADDWTGFNDDFYIEQIDFEILPIGRLQMTFGCERAIDYNFAILDSAIVGTSVVGF